MKKRHSKRWAWAWTVGLCMVLLVGCGAGEKKGADTKATMVSLNKDVYSRGEYIAMTLKNDLDAPLWYAERIACGADFFLVEKCDGEQIKYYLDCEWEVPDHGFTQLAPGATMEGRWNGTLQLTTGFTATGPGCYRMIVPYTTGAAEPTAQEWETSQVKAYSEEFQMR